MNFINFTLKKWHFWLIVVVWTMFSENENAEFITLFANFVAVIFVVSLIYFGLYKIYSSGYEKAKKELNLI